MIGKASFQSTEASHVDHIAHGVHDAARGKEQQSFEERVSEQVEHASGHRRCHQFGTRGTATQCHKHETQLTDSGIRQDAFEVRLSQCRQGCDRRCDCTDGGDCELSIRGHYK